jgi:REP element-mobilizing transposase RayT
MKYDPQIHHRRSIRLKGYDYSQSGLYFITICIQNRECLLGKIEQGLINLNPAGEMIKQMWQQLPQRFAHVQIDKFVVMPNHLHGIISLSMVDKISSNQIQGQALKPIQSLEKPKSVKLGDLIGAFKSMTTHEYIQGVKQYNWPRFAGKLWQRNYYEHIIRDQVSLNNIREYIINNPLKWEEDSENPTQITKS